jgi:hypothetical protein
MEKLTRRPNSKARFEMLATSFSPDKIDSKRRPDANPIRRQDNNGSTFVADLDLTANNVA